jgi:hypothetical protein
LSNRKKFALFKPFKIGSVIVTMQDEINSEKKNAVRQGKTRIAGSIIILAVLANVGWFCFQGMRRCYYYYAFFSSQPEKLTRLAAQAIEIELPKKRGMAGVLLGYAQTPISSTNVEHIKFYGEINLVVIHLNTVSYRFELPWETSEPEPRTKEPLSIPPLIDIKWRPRPSEELFQLELKAARMMPKKYREVLMMSNREFADYMEHAFVKTTVPNQDGTGIFEAEQIKGFVHFGMGDTPTILYAEVFSKQSDITQVISVQSDSVEKSKEAMFFLLASYRFLITELPEQDKLRQLIVSELGKYETFEVVQPQE